MNVATAVPPSTRFVPTIDTLSASQIDAIHRIRPLDKTPDPVLDARRPASIFVGQERFDAEQDKVFRAVPVPMTISALLPEPGSLIAIESYGVPVIVTRARDGEIRAFLNACSHKGSKLIEHGDPHKAGRMTCPYHAWTYGLDGKLLAVPRSETIACFDKADRPLKRLAAKEFGGIVWVGLDPQREYSFDHLDPQVAEDFEALNLPSAHVYGRKQFDLKANWKLVLEPFLEGYHVQRLHSQSVGPMFADVATITDRFGDTLRQTSGKANFTPEIVQQPGENIHKYMTFAYQMFPNTVVITSPYYISVMILAPRGPAATRVDYMMLTREAPDNPKAEELFQRSYEMVLGVFGNEDFRAAELCQAGLSTGALDDVIYCGLEENIPKFYEGIEKRLAA